MRNQTKKLLSFVAAATMLASTLALSACGNYSLDEPLSAVTGEVKSNGGFAVEKGDYVYFINGAEEYDANNTYGDVVKGSLMRISKTALSGGNYGSAEMVIPALVGSQNFNAGIYIFGDYVYYATPTSGKSIEGVVENSWIDFKRAKLDGSETMKDYFFRLESNTAKYRFVQPEDGAVYCLYEEGGMLKSYNTENGETTVLVKGASTYYYNEKDLDDPTVYYTMSVTYDMDSERSQAATYNQIYSVRADATVQSFDSKAAKYTVKGGRTYDFDEAYMKKINDEAKKAADENGTEYTATYDFSDYSTYPYVNLGTLVVDGIGAEGKLNCADAKIPFNNSDAKNELTKTGYTYTLARYDNDGIYFTRKNDTDSDKKLYYYNAEADTTATAKEVAANVKAEVVAFNTTNASGSALMDITSEGKHQYIYLNGNDIHRVTAKDGVIEEDVTLCSNSESVTLWKTEGDFLYYYSTGSGSGNQLWRIKYNGDKLKYNALINERESDDYRPISYEYVDFTSSWYMPEMVGDTLLYANAKSVGSTSYNYVYATKLCAESKDIKSNNEKYDETLSYIETELNLEPKQAALYLFNTYQRTAGDANGEYDTEQEFFKALEDVQAEAKAADEEISWLKKDGDELSVFEEDVLEVLLKNTENKYVLANDLIHRIGEVSEEDAETMSEYWKGQLPYPEEEEEEGLPVWAIVLIVVGSVLVVAAAVTIPTVIVLLKKKQKKAEDEATVNAYKRPKIDTTDDKTIDVYTDEAAEEAPVEETPAQAPVEEAEEAPTEEVPVEQPVENE